MIIIKYENIVKLYPVIKHPRRNAFKIEKKTFFQSFFPEFDDLIILTNKRLHPTQPISTTSIPLFYTVFVYFIADAHIVLYMTYNGKKDLKYIM